VNWQIDGFEILSFMSFFSVSKIVAVMEIKIPLNATIVLREDSGCGLLFNEVRNMVTLCALCVYVKCINHVYSVEVDA
jgi:hypothetical protein